MASQGLLGLENADESPFVRATHRRSRERPEVSGLLTVQDRQLAKSDCDLSHRGKGTTPSGEDSTSPVRDPTSAKRVNSFVDLFERKGRDFQREGPAPFRSSEPVARPPPSFRSTGGERPLTYEEEMRDELNKLRSVVFQMHRRLMEVKEANRILLEGADEREREFKRTIGEIRSRHEERLGQLREKVMLVLSRCTEERSALEMENEVNRSSWLLEKKSLESRIEQLRMEVERRGDGSRDENGSGSSGLTDHSSGDDSGGNVATEAVVRPVPSSPSPFSSSDWDGLYKILYEISVGKLRAFEERSQAKDTFGKSLSDYGYFNLFSELVGGCGNDRCDGESAPVASDDSSGGSPSNLTIRRSSSCPYLPDPAAEPGETADGSPPIGAPRNLPESVPERSATLRLDRMRPSSDRSTVPRPMSIPLMRSMGGKEGEEEEEGEDGGGGSTATLEGLSCSPSPVQDTSSPSVFSRQRLQYKHVCRQPKRTSKRQERSMPLTKSASNSLPTSSSRMDDPLSFPDVHQGALPGSRGTVQSNFERLCHRRNGLVNPDFRCGKLPKSRPTNVIDKLGQNLKQYIGHAKEQRGGS